MRPYLPLVLLGLALGFGCGSVSGTSDGGGLGGSATGQGGAGATGLGGSGGHGGTTGSGGGSGGNGGTGGASCDALASQYAAALPAAQSCDLNASGECQQSVSSSLSP